MAWLAARGWLVQRAPKPISSDYPPETRLARPLLALQVGLGVAGDVCFIGFALWLLVAFFPEANEWTRETGSLLGWIALVSSVTAVFNAAPSLLAPGSRRNGFKALGLVEFAGLALLACSIERLWPGRGWGYRTIMLGSAASALAWALSISSRLLPGLRRSADVESQFKSLHDAAAFWVHILALLALILSVKCAWWHHDQLWAAGAIAMVSPALATVALWRRREGEAFLAGLGVNLAASWIVWHYHAGRQIDWWVYLLQANVIAAALVSLLWMSLGTRLYSTERLRIRFAPLLTLQVAGTFVGNIVLLSAPLFLLVVDPARPFPADVVPVGHVWGWLAMLAVSVSALAFTFTFSPSLSSHVVSGIGLGIGVLLACRWAQTSGTNWNSYHVLMAAWTVACIGTALWSWISSRLRTDSSSRSWVLGIGLLLVALAVRGTWGHDPGAPNWPSGITLAVSVAFGLLACTSGRPFDVYASGLTINVAGSLIWASGLAVNLADLINNQVLCLAVASGLWSIVELFVRRLNPVDFRRGGWLPFPHFASVVALCLLGFTVAWAVESSLTGAPWVAGNALVWASLGALTIALVISFWDVSAIFAPGGLYATGLMSIGLTLHHAELGLRDFCWTAPLVLAPFILLSAGIAWAAPRFISLGKTLHLPDRPTGWPTVWFVPAQAVIGSAVIALSLWIVLDFTGLASRLAGPTAVAVLVAAGVLMAGPRGTGLQWTTLALGVVVVVEAGWALVDPAGHELSWVWLHRNVLLMAALTLMTVVYGLGFSRLLPRGSGWAESSRRIGPILGVLASALVIVVLAQETVLYEAVTPMAPAAIATVALALLGIIAASLCFAVVPGRDPLGLSEQGRTSYVYAAEVLLVLVFVHFRITMPGLFRHGIFMQYWPFIVMAIAFAGAGFSELFRRRGLLVLAEPLEKTGVFLPMLPVLGFWVRPTGNYALLWFLVGLLYGLVAATKRSFRFALLAALSANVGLWVLLHSHDIYFFRHPQLWLIPIALIVLVSEHLNRDRLTASQSAALRYLALIVVYVSSTADMFIAGLGQSWILPLILALLSVLGVLAGMLLRVRAFLFLGVAFLSVDVLAMIWHAGVDQRQTWILYSSGIVLGVALFTLFGIFEKRRNDVLHLVEELRQWR
jgi:hypothetical protein